MSCAAGMAASSWICTSSGGQPDEEISVAETLSSVGKQMLPDYMLLANRLMKEMAQKKRIRNSDDFAANFFLPLYESITGRRIKDSIPYPRSEKETGYNLLLLLNQLSSDLQNISLDHIRVEDLLSGERVATCNLLEILQGLTEYTIKKGLGSKSNFLEDEPLSTFRSQTSNTTLGDDSIDSYQSSPLNSPKIDVKNQPNNRSTPVQFELPTRLPLRPESPTIATAARAVLVETFSMGSSVSGADEEDVRDTGDQKVARPNDKEFIKGLRRQMVRAEKRAERVGLIAQLLSNCALVDKIKARSGRRALSKLDNVDAASEASELAPSLDDNASEDTLSQADSAADSVASARTLDAPRSQLGCDYRKVLRDLRISEKRKLQAERENVPPLTRLPHKPPKTLTKFSCTRPAGSFVVRRQVPLRRNPPPARRELLDAVLSGECPRQSACDLGLLGYFVQELPGMSLSDSALRRLQRYVNPILSPPSLPARPEAEAQRAAATRRLMAEAKRREEILSRMVRREMAAEKRLRELAERRAAETKSRAEERNARLASVRATRYGEELVRELKSLQMSTAAKEEEVIRETLNEGSKLERQHRLELEREVREAEDKNSTAVKGDIESLEHFYRDQMYELTESAKDEKESIEVEAKAKRMQNSQMKQELRQKLESDIRSFQESLRTDVDDAAFFRRLDAQRALGRRQKALRKSRK